MTLSTRRVGRCRSPNEVMAPIGTGCESPAEPTGSHPNAAAERLPRQRWSAEEKARIVRESFRPGERVGDVARRYGLHRKRLSTRRTSTYRGADHIG